MFKKNRKKVKKGAFRFGNAAKGESHVQDEYKNTTGDPFRTAAVDIDVAVPSGPPQQDNEQLLLMIHNNLTEFYKKHKPENVDEDVLVLIMQYFIDSGSEALNKKLMNKYGEDLNNFIPLGAVADIPPPPIEEVQGTLKRMRRQKSQQDMFEQGIPPPPSPDAWFVNNELTNKEVSEDLSVKQIENFKDLMGEQSYDFEGCMVNLGVALGAFQNEDNMDEMVSKYTWVFLTDNPLGESLSRIFVKLEESKVIKKDSNGTSYRV